MERDKNLHNFNDHSNTPETKAPSRILFRVLILGAVLVVLIALSIGIIKLVPKALSSLANVNVSFSSLFSPKEKIAVSTDKATLSSGESFNLSFKHTGDKVDGFFVLSPTCQNTAVHFDLGVNGKRETIGCGSQLRMNASSTSLTLTAFNTGTNVAEIPLVVNFVSNASNQIQVTGETVIKISPANSNGSYQNAGNQATSTNPASGNKPPSRTPSYNSPSNGPADLAVTIIAVGVLNRTNGQFVSTNNVTTNDRVSVKFKVENIGQGPSGSWTLKATLPAVSTSDQVKSLVSQTSIPAGRAVTGEIYFDYIQTGTNKIVQISIDPNNQLTEIRKDNNNVSVSINATGANFNGNNNGGSYYPSNGTDLAVRIMDTGIVDRYSGQFSATNYIRSSDRAAVRFQITNQGSTPSGNWAYSVNLPGSNGNSTYYYNDYNNNSYNGINSNAMTQSNQISLAPGESRIFVVGFDSLGYQGNNTVSINIDPYNQIFESNESNNYASVNIQVSGY